MDDHYENGPEGMPRVKRMTDSTLGWVAAPITLLQLFQAHPGGQEALNQFAHAVAEETLARVPSWPAVPQANAEQDALLEALQTLLNGTRLDAAGNRNDDGLRDRWDGSGISKQLMAKWIIVADNAIRAASKTTPSSGEGNDG